LSHQHLDARFINKFLALFSWEKTNLRYSLLDRELFFSIMPLSITVCGDITFNEQKSASSSESVSESGSIQYYKSTKSIVNQIKNCTFSSIYILTEVLPMFSNSCTRSVLHESPSTAVSPSNSILTVSKLVLRKAFLEPQGLIAILIIIPTIAHLITSDDSYSTLNGVIISIEYNILQLILSTLERLLIFE